MEGFLEKELSSNDHGVEAESESTGVQIKHRPTSADFTELLEKRESIVVIHGVSKKAMTFIENGFQAIKVGEKSIISIDLETWGRIIRDPNGNFYKAIANTFARRMRLPFKIDDVWNEENLNAINFSEFIREVILRTPQRQVVFVLDHVDSLLGTILQNEFFDILRSFHNNRATDTHVGWERLTVVLITRTDPNRFIIEGTESPFSVGSWLIL